MQTRRNFLRTASLTAGAAILPAQSEWMKALESPHANINGAGSLRAHAKAHGILVGCAVDPSRLATDHEYKSTIAEQCSILVAENAMKWGPLSPAPGKYDFREADALMKFTAANGQKVRGHNLIWHDELPDWFAGTITKENARQAMIDHIQTVMQHFAGKIHSWDVVNEAIQPKDGRPDRMRTKPWLDLVGPDYVDIAYRTAREADPKALLTYNDFDIEYPDQEEKRAAVLSLVHHMKATGVPLDAIGVQSHLNVAVPPPGRELQKFVREMAQMNLQVFITELDVNEKNSHGTFQERDAAVAKVYREYLTMMLAEPNVKAVLTWGITDRQTWLNFEEFSKRPDGKPQRPLPFGPDMQPTVAFYAERDAIDTRKQPVSA